MNSDKLTNQRLDNAQLENITGGEARPGYVCRKCLCTQIMQVGSYWVCTHCQHKGPCEEFWTSDVDKTLQETVIKIPNGAVGGW